jgi:hypothetical protein
VLYLAWLHEADVERMTGWWRRRTPADGSGPALIAGERPRFRWAEWCGPGPSAAAFSLLLAIAAVVAVELEQRADRYGEHRAEGRYALREVPEERVQ